mmetsp:Transcript_50282/g.113276  ORF Transcript_50282/g.113276 Transcript_50282/m.113276 type:complete len:809 (-) Transcript_50282:75-2501(-)
MPRRVLQTQGLFDSEVDFIEPEEPVIVLDDDVPQPAATAGSRLDEAALYDIVDEVEKARATFGPSDALTMEAHEKYVAELAKWKMAAQKAADGGDFAEMERLSTTIEMVSSLVTLDDGTQGTLGLSSKKRSKAASGTSKAERKEKKKKDKALLQTGAGFLGDTSAWPSAAGGDQASWDSAAYVVEQPEVDSAWAGSGWYGGGPAEAVPQAATFQGSAAASFDPQVQLLQANNEDLQVRLAQAEEELAAAREEVSSLRAELKDARKKVKKEKADDKQGGASEPAAAMIKEANVQLQSELDAQQRELDIYRQKLLHAEQQASDKDSMLSQVRQRLFKERAHTSELQEQLKAFGSDREALQQQWERHLEKERNKTAAAQRDLLCMQHAIDTTSSLRAAFPSSRRAQSASGVQRHSTGGSYQPSPASSRQTALELGKTMRYVAPEPAQSVMQGGPLRANPAAEGEAPPRVSEHDELSSTVQELKSIRLGSSALDDLTVRSRERASAEQACASLLEKTTADGWARTPRVTTLLPVVLSRTPAPLPEWVERTTDNYRALLLRPRGHFYEDERIVVQLGSRIESSSRGRCHFDVNVTNKSSHPLHHFMLVAGEQPQFGAVLIHVEQNLAATGGYTLWPKQTLALYGSLDALGAFEFGPEVIFSYLLPDNLCVKASVRLPLTVTKFMEPAKLAASSFVELWESAEFIRGEVAFIGTVREAFLRPGGLYLLQQGLQLNGCLAPVSGVDGSPYSCVYAARCSLVGSAGGSAREVLLRAELGGPEGQSPSLRVAVRSTSYIVNRGLGQVILDAVCCAPP